MRPLAVGFKHFVQALTANRIATCPEETAAIWTLRWAVSVRCENERSRLVVAAFRTEHAVDAAFIRCAEAKAALPNYDVHGKPQLGERWKIQGRSSSGVKPRFIAIEVDDVLPSRARRNVQYQCTAVVDDSPIRTPWYSAKHRKIAIVTSAG